MNWQDMIRELRGVKLTLNQIGKRIGMSSGGVHDLTTGRKATIRLHSFNELEALHYENRRKISKARREKV